MTESVDGNPAIIPPAPDIPTSMNRLISSTLRIGVTLSATLTLLGLILLLAGPTGRFSVAATHGTPFTGSAFVSGLLHGQSLDILFLGFIVLIATPLVRVIISVVLFGKIGDRPFTQLTLTVLVLLGLSILIGSLV
jgi:uncharacterized membrane protein